MDGLLMATTSNKQTSHSVVVSLLLSESSPVCLPLQDLRRSGHHTLFIIFSTLRNCCFCLKLLLSMGPATLFVCHFINAKWYRCLCFTCLHCCAHFRISLESVLFILAIVVIMSSSLQLVFNCVLGWWLIARVYRRHLRSNASWYRHTAIPIVASINMVNKHLHFAHCRLLC